MTVISTYPSSITIHHSPAVKLNGLFIFSFFLFSSRFLCFHFSVFIKKKKKEKKRKVEVSGQVLLIVFQIEMEFIHSGFQHQFRCRFQGQIKFIVFQTDISFVRVGPQHLSNYEITPSTGGQWILPLSTIRLKIT